MPALVLVALIASPGVASAASGDNITATESVSFTKRVADIDNCVFNSATIDWGDGTSSAGQFDTGTTNGVKGTHAYAEEGTFSGSVTYNTDCTTNAKVTFTATVGDAPLGNATGSDINPYAGQPFTGVVAHFTDSDPNGTATDYSAQINWGDGRTSAGTISGYTHAGGFEVDVTGTHTYTSAGQTSVNVTIHEVGGSVAYASSSTATIAPTPPPLKASFTWSPQTPCQGGPDKAPTLDASASQGAIATYRWTFTDYNRQGDTETFNDGAFPGGKFPGAASWYSGPTNPQPYDVAHFLRPPTTVTLTVIDSQGHADSVQHTITYADPDETYVFEHIETYGYYFNGFAPKNPHGCELARLLGSLLLPTKVLTLSLKSLIGKVSCPGTRDCIGTVYVVGAGRTKARASRTQVHGTRRKPRFGRYLGRTNFVILAGKRVNLKIPLNKRGRTLASRLRRVRLLVFASGHKPRVVTVRVHRKKRRH